MWGRPDKLRQAWQGKQKVVLNNLFESTLLSIVYSLSHLLSHLYVFMHSFDGHLDEDEETPLRARKPIAGPQRGPC